MSLTLLLRQIPHRSLLLLAALLLCSASWAADPLDIEIDIPHTVHTLDNGLTVIIHEDHKAPIVAVNLWYHVGSKNEERGKTGFAHLFEHLMFNGSENFDHDYFKALETVGATRLNGTTNVDRTNYFQNVPTSAFDLALWMESDRMGHLLGAIDQGKLDEQREVVKNEKRQGLNRPYGMAAELQYPSIYPASHPYSWTTIGSMADLDAATLDDVKEWFRTHYGAANTVVAIAGDVTTEHALARVEHYFGEIEPGPPPARHDRWVSKLTGKQTQIAYDRVSETMVLRSWNVPGYGTREATLLDLLGKVMSNGKSSRLYKRLVYDDQTVTSVNSYVSAGEIAGTFEILAMVKSGVDPAVVTAAIDEEMERFLERGPTRRELQRVKVDTVSGVIRGLEGVGGFGGKSDILASGYVYTGNPVFFKQELEWTKDATARDLLDVAREWLSDGLYELQIRPFDQQFAAGPQQADRSQLPATGKPPVARFEDFERRRLDNGLTLIVATRDSIPVVRMQMMLDAGYAADQLALPGTASLAMDMLDEGTTSRDALEISDELSMLGASLSAGSNLDTSSVSMSSLKTTLPDALDLFADVVLNPSFPEADFQRLKKQQLARIQREKVTPRSMALRVLPKLIYGDDHAYSNPFTGSGTEESLARITLEDLAKFHDTWFKPNHSTLVVVGDISMEEVAPLVERAFRDWETGDVPQKNLGRVARGKRSKLYLVDRPNSPQSLLLAGQIAPPKANPDEIPIMIMNEVIGGAFTSRINMNLREDKGWSYGARTGMIDARGQRIFYLLTSVQTDRTADSVMEAMNEFEHYVGDAPATDEEVSNNRNNTALSLSGRWETAGAVLGSLAAMVQYGLPDNYYANYGNAVLAVTPRHVSRVARQVIDPEAFAWVIVGDRAAIEESLGELGFDEIVLIDADGNRLGTDTASMQAGR